MVRHGRTAWNDEGRYQGHADIDLDDVGRAQAEETAAALASVPVASVASSDLRRARATAEAIAAPHDVAVRTAAALREVDLGRWEGRTSAGAAAAFPNEHARWSAGEDVARGGGETRAAAAARAVPVVLAEVARVASAAGEAGSGRRDQAPAAVVVAHGLVLRATLEALGALGALAAAPGPGGWPHLANGAWVDLDVDLVDDPAVDPAARPMW